MEKQNEMCWYKGCENEIREADALLNPNTAKLCDFHDKALSDAITDKSNTGKLIKFMLNCNSKTKK